MKKQRSSLLAPVLLVGAIVVVVLNTWLAYSALKTLERSQSSVSHTWEVLNQVEQIVTDTKDAESNTRGYLVSTDPDYLTGLRAVAVEMTKDVDQFQMLTVDNPAQQARIPMLRARVEQRLDWMQETVRLHQVGEDETLHARIASGVGKMQMLNLRRLIDDCESEERRLLALRTEDVAKNVRRARLTLFLASGLDLLLIFLMFRYFARERRLKEISEQTAESLAQSRAEVERKAVEIQALNVTLEERVRQRTAELENTNRELEAFSYSVSHDLRAPLRTIDGFSLALEEDYAEAVDDTGRDYIKRVRGGVQRMGMLIDALLQLSRVTRAEIARETVDLTAMVESVAANVKEENADRNLDISVEQGMQVNADPKLLRVAIENLLGNAAKFTGKVAHPQVTFGWDAEQKAFAIKDNGAGFDMHYAGKLFGAFNRLHGDKDFKGSGIGLATVARVIARHHGRIWALGEVDHGASFFFTVGAPHEL